VPDDGAADTSSGSRATAPRDQSMVLQVLLFHPRFVRYLFRVATSGSVSFGWKARAFLALCYVVSPIDLLPEAVLGPLGLFDDLALTLVVFTDLFERVPVPVFERGWGPGAPFARLVGKALGKLSYLVPGPIRAGLRAVLGAPAQALPGGGAPESSSEVHPKS
jgi:hypothetical protein